MALRSSSPDGKAPAKSATQPLNAIDRVLLSLNRVLSSSGYAGFETQMFVWLDGRADTPALRSALARLSLRHPILTARLNEHAPGGPCWQYRRGAECPLDEVTLDSADRQAALDHAARLLALSGNPATNDPIRFSLIHRPDGRDLFVMQYSHVLMDNFAALPLIGEIDRLSAGMESAESPMPPAPDLLAQHLQRFPRRRRLRAALRTALLRLRTLRGPVTVLPRTCDARTAGPVEYRFTTRIVSQRDLETVECRMRRAAALPSMSIVLLASVFQSFRKLRAPEQAENGNFIVGLGVEFGRRDKAQAVFQSLASIVPVRARMEQLADRDELVSVLAGELRHRLHRDIDLGTVQLASMFQNWPRLTKWAVSRVFRFGYSLWYAYFGTQDHPSQEFCGAPISDIYYAASTWSPFGITLIANQSRGRLILNATYLPELIADSTANEFLDSIVAGLRE
jgi:hypothetical protein